MDNTVFWRLSFFVGIFVVMAVLESYLPARHAPLTRKVRWYGNLGLVVVGALVSRLALPITLVGVALWAQEVHIGAFNLLSVPLWLSIAVGVLTLDLAIYWQHRLFHTIPLLWRLHQVHHIDGHVDTTTGLRFHPLEILLSLLIKALVVVALGCPPEAIVIFEIGLNAFAVFNHANIRLPQKWDDILSKVLITQRVHRIHHSQQLNESNSNFGFSVSWWDKLFGSYKARGEKQDEQLEIGQANYPPSRENAGLWSLLAMPFHQPDPSKRSTSTANQDKH
ncbi:sterol desaturase family protein [Alteromonas sp. C1M14]|uniref:sterol desaturase family protein n=1 Tax=Alteromonas sp. C1M14 TaxID=2841567 RepID=UPI001C08BC85|nr:sterol desaturase family protein [Alteromonas sp. C1M14]MBU2979775.1 sterol desaturase family protein [Alteromonas sp. C1M14]